VEDCGNGKIGAVTPQFEWTLVNNELQRMWKVAVVAGQLQPTCFEGLSKFKRNISYNCSSLVEIRTWQLSRNAVACGSISGYVVDIEKINGGCYFK
jgi:hypothetical protein